MADAVGPDEGIRVRDVHTLPDAQRARLAHTLPAAPSCRARARAPRGWRSAHGAPSTNLAQTSHVERATGSSWSPPWAPQGAYA